MKRVLLIVSMLVFLVLGYADSNGVWIKAEDIRGGTLASDEGNGQFTFGLLPKLPLAFSATCTILSVDNNGNMICTTEQDTLNSVTSRGFSTANALEFKLFTDSDDSSFGVDPNGNSKLNILTAMNNVYVNGNIGIGTTTPTQKLEVLGTTKTNDLMLDNIRTCSGKLITDATGRVSCGTDNVNDADADPTNELQSLSISGNTLSISSKNSVTLPSGTNYNGLSCPVGQYVQGFTVAGALICTNLPPQYLMNNIHLASDCTSAGGTVAGSLCKFSGTSCPTGWNDGGWTTTVNKNCDPGYSCTSGCNTGSHVYSASTVIETCSYKGTNNIIGSYCANPIKYSTCSATRTEIGCY